VTIRAVSGNQQTKVLDRESFPAYVYQILARDGSFQSATMTLSITITDINDNSPFFINAPYFFTVNENEPNNVAVGTVTVSIKYTALRQSFKYLCHVISSPLI
jgi:hypothetical protein